MKKTFARIRIEVAAELQRFLRGNKPALSQVNSWGPDVLVRLERFSMGGKIVRGTLVVLTCEMYGGKNRHEAIALGAAVELIHSSILAHDDIIDEDELRRGGKTLHAQYRDAGRATSRPDHFGMSAAICAADAGFFLAQKLLARSLAPKRLPAISELLATELVGVALGEIDDVYISMIDDAPLKRALAVSKWKTARYTFSMPLMLGATLAETNEKQRKLLGALGESLGMLFQLRDDWLGIYGDSKRTGKPVGSDVRGNKKTVYQLALFASGKHSAGLRRLFGKQNLTRAELERIKKELSQSGIEAQIERVMDRYETGARIIVSHLAVSDENKKLLFELIRFCRKRDS